MGVGSLIARGLSVTPEGRRRPVVKRLDLELEPGAVVGLTGRSGVGKTTLLHALNGLIPWFSPGVVSGSIELDGESLDDLDPGQRAHLLGSCLDRPEAQLFLPTPGRELEAAKALYGESPIGAEVSERLGVGPLRERRIVGLSSGERQRIALAVALSAAPRPILLDEPTAHLDSEGAGALLHALEAIVESGGSVLAAEQAGWRLGSLPGEWRRLQDAEMRSCVAPEAPVFQRPHHAAGDEHCLSARGVAPRVAGRQLFSPVDLDLMEGEVVVLTGPNGAGKSSLARYLTGHLSAGVGRVSHAKGSVPALMLPDARLQLFERTVENELRARGASVAAGARVLRRHRLEALSARAPWSLSRGERQRLVHAALDVMQPRVLVVDEPAQGLDPEDLADFVRLVHRRAERGRAYLMITHREELAGAAHRHLRLKGGRLEEVVHD